MKRIFGRVWAEWTWPKWWNDKYSDRYPLAVIPPRPRRKAIRAMIVCFDVEFRRWLADKIDPGRDDD